jgi:hypothetical protein
MHAVAFVGAEIVRKVREIWSYHPRELANCPSNVAMGLMRQHSIIP